MVPQGAANACRLIAIVEDPDNGLPANARPTLTVLITALAHLDEEMGGWMPSSVVRLKKMT